MCMSNIILYSYQPHEGQTTKRVCAIKKLKKSIGTTVLLIPSPLLSLPNAFTHHLSSCVFVFFSPQYAIRNSYVLFLNMQYTFKSIHVIRWI